MASEGLTILVGTTKGAFLIDGGPDRSGWAVRGPFCDGWPINHAIADPETGTIWAGGGGDWSEQACALSAMPSSCRVRAPHSTSISPMRADVDGEACSIKRM